MRSEFQDATLLRGLDQIHKVIGCRVLDMSKDKERKALRVVPAPAVGSVLPAPPPLMFSTHTVEFTCGRCETVLMKAEDEQVHGLVIHCLKCGSYNATE